MTDIVEGAFYWAFAYGEEKEPTVVQRLNGEWWLPGFEDGLRDHQLRIIEKIEPPNQTKKLLKGHTHGR